MDHPSAADDLAFAQGFVAKARAAGADEAQVRLSYDEGVEVDFETRRLSMLRTTRQDDILLTVFKSTRKGSATIAGRAPEARAQAVQEALAAAEAAPPDPANGIALSESGPPAVYGPAEPDQKQLVDAARAHIDQMAREHPAIVTRDAYHRFNRTRRSFANSHGVVRQETRGRYSFFTLFAAQRNGHATSMNYHRASSYAPFANLSEVGALPQLYGEMARSFDARPAPGKFIGDVILTPDALGGMLIWPLARALGGYSLLSGTSPYRDRRGQVIASPAFSLLNRPTPRFFPEGIDFDAFGIPTGDLDVIKDGILRDFLVDHYISRKLGIDRTAVSSMFVVPPGEKSAAQIIAETERGIVLTRFSGGVPAENLDFSGIAKNAFYVESGEARYPLSETMISGNLRDLILAIRDVSRETINFGMAAYPTVAAGGVTIHGR